MHTATEAEYAGTPGRTLTQAGYRSVSFYARGSLTSRTVAKIEVADDADGGRTPPCVVLYTDQSGVTNDLGNPCPISQTLTDSWRQYRISIDPSVDLAGVKDYLKATLVFNQLAPNTNPGTGGIIYLDQIFYEP